MLNRTALITGGSSGIGYAIAESFIKNGATITICGRNEKKLISSKNSIISNCNCSEDRIEILVIDLSDVNSAKNHLNEYLYGKNIDIFVNCAGINGGNLFPNTSEDEYDRVLNTNLKGMYFFSQEIAKYMVENKIEGNILNITLAIK